MKLLLIVAVAGLSGCGPDTPNSTTVPPGAVNAALAPSAPAHQLPVANTQKAILLEKQVMPATQPTDPSFEF